MTSMRALIACSFGLAVAQTTQSGCTCKSYSEVTWRSAGGIEGGFSHAGCGTGPFEDKSPAKGQAWCDTQQTQCNSGQGWDFCTRAGAQFEPEQVNVNWNTDAGGMTTAVNVNVNVNSVSSSSGPPPIMTMKGCTCHLTSEVIMKQNGVRVGGGFSHMGCGTGAYEATSPGHGSPWCDTVETRCADGWDLCIPPSYQQNSPIRQPQNSPSTSSYSSYSSQTFLPPTPQPRSVRPITQSSSSSSGARYLPPTSSSSSRYVVVPPPPTPSSYRYASQTVQQPPPPPSYTTQVLKPQSPFAASKSFSSRQPEPRSRRRGGSSGYDYDDSSSSSSLLPLMLMSGSASSNTASDSKNLLPLMLATQGGASSSMLPMMMMMMESGGLTMGGGSSSTLAKFAMLNAFREGDGVSQDGATLGEIGEGLGFTRAVVTPEDPIETGSGAV